MNLLDRDPVSNPSLKDFEHGANARVRFSFARINAELFSAHRAQVRAKSRSSREPGRNGRLRAKPNSPSSLSPSLKSVEIFHGYRRFARRPLQFGIVTDPTASTAKLTDARRGRSRHFWEFVAALSTWEGTLSYSDKVYGPHTGAEEQSVSAQSCLNLCPPLRIPRHWKRQTLRVTLRQGGGVPPPMEANRETGMRGTEREWARRASERASERERDRERRVEPRDKGDPRSFCS